MKEHSGGVFRPVNSERSHREQDANGDLVLNFNEILRILRRGLWIIAACVFLGALVATVWVLRITPTYFATAQIVLDQQNAADDRLGALFQDLNLDNQKIASEIAVMQSGRVLTRVADTLNLETLPEFNADLRPPPPEPSLLSKAITGTKGLIKTILGGGTDTASGVPVSGDATVSPIDVAAGAEADALGEQADYVGQLAGGVRVRQVGSSFLVNISYISTNPKIAAAVANTVADEYISFQLEQKLAASGRLTEGLNSSIDKSRQRLEESEQKVIDFRNRMLDAETGGSERLEQQIRELSSRLVNASAEHAELKAELNEIDTMIAENGVSAAAGVLDSDLAKKLQNDLSSLQQREVEVRERFGETSPRTVSIREQITLTEGTIEREISRLRGDLVNQTAVARARESSLREQLLSMEQRYLKLQKQQIELSQLERVAEVDRVIYEENLKTVTETSDVNSLLEADARVVTYASPPTSPAAPRKKLSVALGIVGGGFLGLCLVFMRSFLDKTVSTPEQLRRVLGGVPVVASLPMARASLRRENPLKFVSANPGSHLMEAVRTLRNYLILKPSSKGHTIAVISSVPSEGKTSSSLLLAKSVVQMGMSCVVVDTDMRKGGLAEFLAVPPKPDLFDLLFENATLQDVLRRDPLTGAHVITSKPGASDPASLLYSRNMTSIIKQLENQFDLVILDTAPLLPVSDALALVKQADEVVLAVRWRSTPTDKINQCMSALQEVGITPTCAVLTLADAKQIPTYDYYNNPKNN